MYKSFLIKITVVSLGLIMILINYFFFYKTEFRVLHAGGLYNKKTYTNSIESFEKNGKYLKYLEVDFQMTKDNKLICTHDHIKEISTYKEFLLKNKKKEIKECDYKSLSIWLKKNPDKIIITDVKTNNLEGLKFIKNNFENFQKNFIPQIYDPKNYDLVKDMGYEDIIWTLYRYGGADKNFDKITNITKKNKFFAITMPHALAYKGLSKKIKEETSTKVLVHTINFRREVAEQIFFYDVTDVYTDTVLNDVNNIFSWFWKKIILR